MKIVKEKKKRKLGSGGGVYWKEEEGRVGRTLVVRNIIDHERYFSCSHVVPAFYFFLFSPN